MVKKKLKKHYPLIKVLHKVLKNKNKTEFENILNCLNDDSLNFLCECVKNTCDKECFNSLPPQTQNILKKKLLPHKSVIKNIIKKETHIQKKRKILQKGSGWFLPILGSILPIISNLLTGN